MKKNIVLMYAISLFQGMVFYAAVSSLYRRAQGVTVFQITLIESLSLLLCLGLEIPWGFVADRIGYKRSMVYCNALFFLSKIVFWQASGFWGFLLERLMLSVVFAGLSGVDSAILYLSSEKGKSQQVFGVYHSLGTVGLLVSALVFSAFFKDDYRLAAFCTAISYGLSALLTLFLTEMRDGKSHRIDLRELQSLLRGVFQNKDLLKLLLAVAFLTETHQTITVFLSQFQYERCGLSPSLISYAFILLTLAGLFGVFSARLTKALGMKASGILLWGAVLTACVVLAFTGKALLSVGGILLMRASYSLFQPFQLEMQNLKISTPNRATALSINAMIINSVAVGSNLAFGALAENSLRGAFLFGAGLCFLGLLLFLSRLRRMKAEQIKTELS